VRDALAAFVPVLIAYYIFRKHYPHIPRPFRLPEWWKYMALVLAALYAFVWCYGGPVYALSKFSLAGQSTIVYYAIGLVTILSYMPLHWWRKHSDERKLAAAAAAAASASDPAMLSANLPINLIADTGAAGSTATMITSTDQPPPG